ncbi:hypothetical protein B4U80_01033 [Leptotrombidium deliense]|uniref:Uncharacterized protein n=1 Tax=Leptotrombidium deliense TaxID=299467 RepID=A0A443S2J2_9ACAR|nr:hypothetical protein B4U80_01033 [Leptotrombidium deliense]
MAEKVELNSLRLRYNAEFDDWQDFVAAVDEFQKATNIKLTITTSKKLGSSERQKKRAKHEGVLITVADEEQAKERFEYKYLKLTCKHYGGYRSTSRGIRPNQKTVKLMCPTYLYGAYDHYKDRFCIKQMVVNCNHELKDEEVLLPSILKNPTEGRAVNDGPKKYVRKRNRCVLKVPLESPTSGTLIVSLKSRVKCNHDSTSSSTCEAHSLTSHDLSSIISHFSTKTKEEQNELILQWVDITPIKKDDSSEEDKLQVQFRLPTIDDSLIKVCSKSFLSILNLNMNRVDGVISANYADRISLAVQDQNCFRGNEEVETSIATILTSLSREDPQPQILYIDHVDIPSAEDTIEDAFVETTITSDSSPVNTITINISQELPEKVGDISPLFLADIPWSRQENDQWSNSADLTGDYFKVDTSRNVVLLSVSCRGTNFVVKVYNEILNLDNVPVLKNLQKQYLMNKVSTTKPLLDRLNSLKLCRGLSDNCMKEAMERDPSLAAELAYCFYSNSFRSKKCELVFGDDSCLVTCRECDVNKA